LEKESEVNIDQVIEDIQVEHVEPIEPMVPTVVVRELVVVATRTFQPIQLVVEFVHPENPQLFTFHSTPICGHFIKK
jgi:hypothetical protein